jgi:hypothetical protein
MFIKLLQIYGTFTKQITQYLPGITTMGIIHTLDLTIDMYVDPNFARMWNINTE